MKKRLFLKNALILTVTALILRAVGMVFRVYLADKIGAEGMGLYQLIFSVYILVATFATTGISTAVTRLITDELVCGTPKSVARITRRAVALISVMGLVSCAAVYFGAPLIGEYWIRDVRAVPALQILSFSLPFMGVSSCLKGYFMARRRVSSNSNAQLFEQLIRICIVVFLLQKYAPLGVAFCCTAVLIGDTAAEICSCVFMAVCYLRDKRRLRTMQSGSCAPQNNILRRLLKIAVPISAGRYLSTGLRTAENLLVPETLGRYAASKELGLSQFGMLKGMALPILFFPSSFLTAMSALLVPEISEAAALSDDSAIRRAVCRSIKITLMMSILISGLFMLFASDVGLCVYKSGEVGFLIKVLSPLVPFMYLESVTDGMLKGLNQQNHSLMYAVADSLLRIGLILWLVPRYGMPGFLFMMILSNVFTSALNVHRLIKVSDVRLLWGEWVLKPLFAAAVSVLFVYFTVCLLPGTPAGWTRLLCCIPLAAAIYFAALFFIGGITREDLGFLRRKNKQAASSHA